MTSYRARLVLLALPPLALAVIGRPAILASHNVVRTRLVTNETTPLQVGNGNFAFSVDSTGLQSYLPFNTLSSWAWHNDSLPANGEQLDDYKGTPMDTHGREVYHDNPDPDLPAVSQWLIGNPNRVNLGRIGLRYQGRSLGPSDISSTRQELDLYGGFIRSSFVLGGHQVSVLTRGDFESDSVAFHIESSLIGDSQLQVELDFPYPPLHTTEYKYEVFVGVYNFPLNHTTQLVPSCQPGRTAHIQHVMQETAYYVNLAWPSDRPLSLSRDEPAGAASTRAHQYTLALQNMSSNSNSMSFTANFSPRRGNPASPDVIAARNIEGWHQYWDQGGFVDLTGSSNANATELQRRILLSQYHVRVNSAAKGQSPQESGLMNNGWYGKFHMEMVVWHNAHWCVWGRQKHFDDIFPELYFRLLPTSRERAKKMGWAGARWPKMTEVSTGRSSPGAINALLLWQQPHAIYMAEMAYRAHPTKETLEKWEPIVAATADYMASFAWENKSSGHFDLGPPAYGVTENTPPRETLNLAYEISYWRWGLDAAISWLERLGRVAPDQWHDVSSKLAPAPIVDGLYAPYQGLNASWWSDSRLTADPRSLVMLQGILPTTPHVDAQVAKRTADRVAEIWTDDKIRGWGRNVLAINAARTGDPDRAIRHLTAFDYWIFDDAGFAVRGGDGGTPPPFMPGNAGFLLADTDTTCDSSPMPKLETQVAYMIKGWEGFEGELPGFPDDGSWVVRHEGLSKAL